jgi:gluconate 2-dehydrogenase gamma chain
VNEISRREALVLLGVSPLLTAAGRPAPDRLTPHAPLRGPGTAEPELRFFTPHEYATAAVLADLVIPADERSGSATQAGVVEFMDFMLDDAPTDAPRVAIRGGLRWLDHESRHRFDSAFRELTEEQQTEILDDIAWPARARPAMSHGVAFFNAFRDLVLSGFFSSELGVEDLRYLGNTVVIEWPGCPPEALERLGVRYAG